MPASRFPHECLSVQGERQLCSSQPTGTGTVWALRSCFHQSRACPHAEHTEHPAPQALGHGICRSTGQLLLPAHILFHWTAQHRDSKGGYHKATYQHVARMLQNCPAKAPLGTSELVSPGLLSASAYERMNGEDTWVPGQALIHPT